MMIEKVMIQKGQNNKKRKKSSGGVISSSAARPHGTSEDSNTGRKPPKAKKPKSHLPQRNWQCRGCEKRGTVNADDAK